MYSNTTDLRLRFAPGFLRAMADDDGDSSPDEAVMLRAIADADGQIDARLSTRYATPFAGGPPPLVAELSAVLAGANLARRAPTAAAAPYRGDFDRARDLLAMLATGEAELPGVAPRRRVIALEGASEEGRVFGPGSIDGY